MRHLLTCALVMTGVAWGAEAKVLTFSDLTFTTDVPQSSWGTGAALEIEETIPFVAEWDENLSFGEVADLGSAPNPAYITADGLYLAANATYSTASSAYTKAKNAYSGCLDKPLGNVVTCSALGLARNTAKAVRDTAKTARDKLLTARNALPENLDLGKAGTQINVASSGEVGFELEYKISAGSVDPTMTFAIGAEVPDEVASGEVFSISATQSLLSGEVSSTAPGFEFAASTIVDVDLSVSALACAVGCVSGGATLIDIDDKTEIISIDNAETRFLDGIIDKFNSPVPIDLTFPTGTLEAQLFAGVPTPATPPLGLELNGVAVSFPQPVPPTIEIAAATLTLPQIETASELKDGKIVAEGADQVLKLSADVDALLPQIPVGGLNFSFGPPGLNAGASFDAFDIKAGPTLDLTQKFEIDGSVIVDLQFSETVAVKTQLGFLNSVGDTCLFADLGSSSCNILDLVDPYFEFVDKTSYVGIWGDLPEMKLYNDTIFTPKFSAAAEMLSVLGLQFGVSLDVLFGRGDVNVGPLKFAVGPIFAKSFPFQPDFAAFDVYSDMFAVEGWNSIAGDSFAIKVAKTVAPVPVPASLLLMGSALIGIGGMRRWSR